jgi:DNA invertase Pin-like site-specific DNA recombinase
MRVGIYVRLSFDPEEKARKGRSEAREGDAQGDEVAKSPARQEADCRRFAELRGDEVVRVYSDPDLSAYTGIDRPKFEELLADAEARVIDGILVWRLDRLTRNFDDLQRIWKLIGRGVTLLAVHDSIDTSTASGVFMLRTLVAIAEYESASISLRTRRAKAESARNGLPNPGGMRAFGYAPDKRQLVPEEAAAIKEAAERVLDGQSLRSVADDFNRRGIRTPRGKTWLPGTLAGVLVNPRIAGLRAYKGTIVADAAWPAIITREQHEKLVALRKDPTRRWVPRGRPAQHLLAGMVECARCGERAEKAGERANRMVNRPEGGRDYYMCRKPPLGRGCGALVSGRQLDALVVERMFAALDSEEFTQALKGPRPADAEVARQLEEDEGQLRWLGREMGSDPLRRPAFLAAIAEVETRVRQNRARLARQQRSRALAALPEDLDQLRHLWEHVWTLDRKRALLDTLIEKVIVQPSTLGSRTGRRFDRSRARIVWRV